jgi:hypothetical protein
MGVAAILPDEIVLAPADDRPGNRPAPMSADRFGVLTLEPHAIEILTNRRFDGDVARRSDRNSRHAREMRASDPCQARTRMPIVSP